MSRKTSSVFQDVPVAREGHRLERWTSDAGHALLERVLRRPGSLPALAHAYGFAFWERAILRDTKVPRRVRTRRGRTSWVGRLARQLDLFRREEQWLAAAHPFPRQRAFRGNLDHLARLERSVSVPVWASEWNHWRKHARRIKPDLRGANLSGLRLDHLDLGLARLTDADLSGARLSRVRHADLRRTRLVGSNLAAADLRGVNLTEALLKNTDLTDADLSNATLCDANLIGCALNQAELKGTDLRRALVSECSVWGVNYDATTKQMGLYLAWKGIHSFGEYDPGRMRRPIRGMRVDSLELAGIMELVKKRPRALGELFKEVSNRVVLLLGRFTGKYSESLSVLERTLERDYIQYIPVRFDFDASRDQIDTVAALAGLCRFIIADVSDPKSALIEAQRIIPAFTVPFVPILSRDAGPVALFETLQRKYPWVVRRFVYANEGHLRRSLTEKIVIPAERVLARLRRMMR